MRLRNGIRKKKERGKKRGIALIAVLGLISTLSILSIALIGLTLAELKSAERYENRLVAFHQADGAIDQTLVNLRMNKSFGGIPSTDYTIGRTAGIYFTIVTQSLTNPNIYTILSTGNVGAAVSAYGFQQRQISAIVDMTPSAGNGSGIFSNGAIQISGNVVIDAYDSREGPYNPLTATAEGNVGTNSTSPGFVVQLTGNVRVEGNLTIGPGGNLATATQISGNATITGTKTAADALTPMTPVSIPSSLTDSGALSVNGQNTVTLGSGTYYFSSIDISGGGKLNVTGEATIYVSGDVNISGNGIGTASNLPPNLIINVEGAHNVSVSGDGDFYGKIYAPESSISVSGNGDLYGALIGDTFSDSGNGNIHYDKALGSGSSSQATDNELKAWTEVSF